MRYGASPAQLKSNKRIDAYNAGYRSVSRGHDGTEARYARYLTSNAEAFNEGREDALRERNQD